MTRADLRDVLVCYQTRTRLAVCVRVDEESDEDVWIPLSRCEIDPPDPERGDAVTLTAPEGVLAEKGLDIAVDVRGVRTAPGLFDAPPPAARQPAPLTHQQLADRALASWSLLQDALQRIEAAAINLEQSVSWNQVTQRRAEITQARRESEELRAILEADLRAAAERRAQTDAPGTSDKGRAA